MPNPYVPDSRRLMFDEHAMGVTDGVSPIDSINKFFYLDWKGIDRYHQRLMNYFLHSNLKDIDPVQYNREDVYNKKPAFYKQSFDEFGHTVKIQEVKPSINVLTTPTWKTILTREGEATHPGSGDYALPSKISSSTYESLSGAGLLSTNVTYLIEKLTQTDQIVTENNKKCYNAPNNYHEFLLTSCEYNKDDGYYYLTWEMFGGDEGSGSGGGTFVSEVIVTTLNPGQSATAAVNNIAGQDEPPLYQLSLGIPKGASGSNGADGQEIQLRTNDGWLQYKYENELNWTNLLDLSTLVGPSGADGHELEIRVQNKVIQSKYDNEQNWTDLINLATAFPVDSALSSTSENPVQNKVLYQTLGDIQTILASLTTPSSP